MGKRTMKLIMLIIVMFSLLGCDIQDQNLELGKSKIETNEVKENNKIITTLNNKHNQYNAYRICEENEDAIQQLDLEGNPVRTWRNIKRQEGKNRREQCYD